jgi:G patch domain-containing protein 2
VGHAAGFAAFEQHGSGIGSRLMQRMGWSVGEGLGRARQGMPEPLAAVMRPKHRGLGAE